MLTSTVGTLYDRCVQYYGDEIAITHGDIEYSYADIGNRALSLLNALQNLGFRKGDKVAFLMANCPEIIFSEYAIAKGGGIRVPLAVLLGEEDHLYMMNLTECRALIYHARFTERVLRMVPQLETVEHYICVSNEPENVPAGHLHFQTLMSTHPPDVRPVEVESEDLAAIYFTGGTTGQPKGVMLSHRAWTYTYVTEILDFGIEWGEVFVFPTPLTHAGGCLILPVLLRNGRCVIIDHFDPGLLLETIEREAATATLLVPTMIYVLLDFPALGQYRLDSLRNILYGAASIAPDRLKQALDYFGPVFTQFFGQTEAPMAMSALTRTEHLNSDKKRERMLLSSAGRPTLHTELKLLDDDGKEVAAGEVGEVVVRCANVMHGYYKNPEATAEAIRDGWLYTGDIAWQDEEGYIYIVDRKKDMIISGGFNVFPREVEDILFEHPAIKQAAVVGVPHEKWGEEVRAIVVVHDSSFVSEAELIEFVKRRKGSVMTPKRIEFWDEIPLTNLGKIDKKRIRSLCENRVQNET